jgi:hypothetical protein
MPYYRVTSPDSGENILVRKASHSEVLHTSGAYIQPNSVDLPFKFEMDVGEAGYDQFDPDFEGEANEVPVQDRLLDYYSNVCVMSPQLLQGLVGAGVDNLQNFPAEITNSESGQTLEFPYVFVNVIGLVSCADTASSDATPIGPSSYFHELVVDESRIRDLLLFRLKESPFEIVVHDRVAEAIAGGGFRGIGVEKLASR